MYNFKKNSIVPNVTQHFLLTESYSDFPDEGEWHQTHNTVPITNKSLKIYLFIVVLMSVLSVLPNISSVNVNLKRNGLRRWTLLSQRLIAPPLFHYLSKTANVECMKCPAFHASFIWVNECIIWVLKVHYLKKSILCKYYTINFFPASI